MKLIPKREPEYESLVAQETLILEATETIVGLMNEQNVSRLELSRRLGRTKAFVSQVLAGDRNMTLRTLADLAYALGCTLRMTPEAVERIGVERAPARHPVAQTTTRVDELPVYPESAAHVATDSHEYALAA